MKILNLRSLLSISAIGALLLTGCSSKMDKPNPIEGECKIAGVEAPGWACGSYSEDGRYIAVGSAPISKLGHEFSRKEALMQARSNLSDQIKIEVRNIAESYMRSTGLKDQELAERVITQATKQLSKLTLNDSRQISYWENEGDNSIYVLVAMDKNNAKEFLETQVENDFTTMQNNSQEVLNKLD